MTKHFTFGIVLTLFTSCKPTSKNHETTSALKNQDAPSIYHLDTKTRKEMTDSLIQFYKLYGDSQAVTHAEAFVNRYETLQIEQQDSILYMSDIYVQFKNSKLTREEK